MIKFIFFALISITLKAQCPLIHNWKVSIGNEERHEETQFLLLNSKEQSVLEETQMTPSENILSFRDFISTETTTDWKELIKKQNRIFERGRMDTSFSKKILNGEIGHVRKINFIESLLLELHLGYQEDYYTEFLALAFKKESKLKLIFLSFNSPSGSIPRKLEKLRTKFLSNNWDYLFILHNHPFNFNNPYGDIGGTPVPSSADLNFFEEQKLLGLEKALITNGFHTIEL